MSNCDDTDINRNERFQTRRSDPLVPGFVLDQKFELTELLGQGKMGKVFLAQHLILGLDCVVKILEIPGVYDDETWIRFKREAHVAASLKSTNIIEVVDAGISPEEYPYIVMPHLAGETLQHWIDNTPLEERDFSDIADYVLGICEGLAVAHQRNYIHRDIKPGNVFLHKDDDGDIIPKILDFGVVRNTTDSEETRVTLAGQSFGTPGYRSPEQAKGYDPDALSDVFSTGAVLYKLITDCTVDPYAKLTPPVEINPDVPKELNKICLKALEPLPAKRYRDVNEMSEALCYGNPTIPRKKIDTFHSSLFWFALGVLLAGVSVYFLFAHGDGGNTPNVEIADNQTSPANRPKNKPVIDIVAVSNSTSDSTSSIDSPDSDGINRINSDNSDKGDDPKSSTQTTRSTNLSNEKRVARSNSTSVSQPSETDTPDKSSYDELVQLAKNHMRELNYADAEFAYKEAIKLRPNSAAAWFALGEIAIERQDFHIAADRIRAALKIRDRGRWRNVFATTLWNQGIPKEALKEWQNVANGQKYTETERNRAAQYLDKYNKSAGKIR